MSAWRTRSRDMTSLILQKEPPQLYRVFIKLRSLRFHLLFSIYIRRGLDGWLSMQIRFSTFPVLESLIRWIGSSWSGLYARHWTATTWYICNEKFSISKSETKCIGITKYSRSISRLVAKVSPRISSNDGNAKHKFLVENFIRSGFTLRRNESKSIFFGRF